MSSRRRSLGRIFLLVCLVIAVFLLLELGRLLPGSWPGGDGNRGSRSFPTQGGPDPTRLVPSTTPPPPAPIPNDAGRIRVVVRRADGTPVEGGSVLVGGQGSRATTPLVGGEALLDARAPGPEEWTLVLPDGARIGHGPPPSRGEGRWIATLPRRLPEPAPDPTARGSQAAPTFLVEDADGRPIAGATVTSTRAQTVLQIQTDAHGEATLPDFDGLQRLCFTADGFGEWCTYARLGSGKGPIVRLSPTRPRRTTFVDPASGAALRARSLALIDRRGFARHLARDGGTFDEFSVTIPDDVAAESVLEIDVEGRPPVRVPLPAMGGSTPVPTGAPRTIRLLDEKGEPVADAVVTAHFASGTASEHDATGPIESSVRTDAGGRAVLTLPLDRDTDLVVDSPSFVTKGMRVRANAPIDAAPLDIRTSRGVDCLVTVSDAAGSPVVQADVFVLTAADRSTARRHATTNAAGEATVAAIAPGPIEVLVHRAGFAWTSRSAIADDDATHRTPVVLQPGRRLTLVVESVTGVPLPRVAVISVPHGRASAASPTEHDASDPDAKLPWETDGNGVLVVEDLPDRELDLYLSKPGFDEEVVASVRPGASTWFATLVKSGTAK